MIRLQLSFILRPFKFELHSSARLDRIFLFFLFVTSSAQAQIFEVERIGKEPIVDRSSFIDAGAGGQLEASDEFPRASDNINGPSVIQVSDWMRPRLANTPAAEANYFLYFAHHRGAYMRMAHARQLSGPWALYNPLGEQHPENLRGVLDLGPDARIEFGNGLFVRKEVASPDVFVDDENERVVMYFHSATHGGQKTFVATSADGLNFNMPAEGNEPGQGIRPVKLGQFYFRVFEHRGRSYAWTNNGYLYRGPEGASPVDDAAWTPPNDFDLREADLWERIDGPIRATHEADPEGIAEAPRHFATFKDGNKLYVLFTRRWDRPERIFFSVVDLSPEDWTEWTASYPPVTILEPELDWEGANHPRKGSGNGAATGVRQLRDPYIFTDKDDKVYLFYTGAGEEAIGIARLEFIP